MRDAKIILVLVFTTTAVFGQTEKLLQHGLITKKDREFVASILVKSPSNLDYINVLSELHLKKSEGSYYGKSEPASREQIREVSNYLLKLRNADIVTQKQFTKVQQQVTKGEYPLILQMLSAVNKEIRLDEMWEPSKTKPFIEKLKENSIVTSKYDRLVKDVSDRKLEQGIDYLNYFDKAVIINTNDYPGNPKNYLEAIHRKTATVLPELDFTDFNFTVEVDTMWVPVGNDAVAYDVICSFKCHERQYRQRSNLDGGKIDRMMYFRIFNKILNDLQSPYRLVMMMDTHRMDSVNPIGIVALTEQQLKMFEPGKNLTMPYDFMVPVRTSYKMLTSDQVDSIVEKFKLIGLLDHLSEAQLTKALNIVAEKEHDFTQYIPWSFPSVIYEFNTELDNLKDPYTELTKEFSKITRGAMNPTDISDDFNYNGRLVTLRFNMNGKSYEKNFKISDDWMDPEFFNFMNSVASDIGHEGRFFTLAGGGQEVAVIYLTPRQYKYLRDNKLLNF